MRWFLAGLLLLAALIVAATPAKVAAQAANEVEIIIGSGGFSPNPATIPPGFSAVWCNDDTAVHSIAFDAGPTSPDLAEGECLEPVQLAPGSYPYHDGHNAAITGTVTFEAPASTTTTATTAPPGATTTVGATATTRRATTTTKPVIRKSATTRAMSRSTSTSIVASTSTSAFFDTTTSEFTTSTFGEFAINEPPEGSGSDTGTAVAIVAGLAVLGGAGYLGYRNRYRFIR